MPAIHQVLFLKNIKTLKDQEEMNPSPRNPKYPQIRDQNPRTKVFKKETIRKTIKILKVKKRTRTRIRTKNKHNNKLNARNPHEEFCMDYHPLNGTEMWP